MAQLFEVGSPHWQDIWYALGVTGTRVSELARLEFTHEFLDWENREVIIPKWLSKNHVERRIPMDDHLYEILRRLDRDRETRQPGRGRNKRDTEKVKAKFTRDRIFVTTEDTPLQRTNLYRTFMRCCKKAGIETRTYDGEGRLLTHVDLHSLRRTFTTDAISNGADPGTVQQILGHKTLKITMNVYNKAQRQTKRRAIASLSYGAGSRPPEHVLEMPAQEPNSVQNGDQAPANSDSASQAQ
jgi:integrase